jgi:hypothetical protein
VTATLDRQTWSQFARLARTHNDFKSKEYTFMEERLEQITDITSCGQDQGRAENERTLPDSTAEGK